MAARSSDRLRKPWLTSTMASSSVAPEPMDTDDEMPPVAVNVAPFGARTTAPTNSGPDVERTEIVSPGVQMPATVTVSDTTSTVRLPLVAAPERPAAVEEAAKALEARLRNEARTIREKYIEPPATTDFAILFLPTEGLYAEALRRPGLVEALQREHRVTLAGPTTLLATLSSLQMGFRTLAIEKRSSEVWAVLGAVKLEFGRFGDVLANTRKQLQTVANSIDLAETRTRQIERKLKDAGAPAVAGTR